MPSLFPVNKSNRYRVTISAVIITVPNYKMSFHPDEYAHLGRHTSNVSALVRIGFLQVPLLDPGDLCRYLEPKHLLNSQG